MTKQKLLRRLRAALVTNHGAQPTHSEIWQRLKSSTPREVDVLCCSLDGQLNKEVAASLEVGEKPLKSIARISRKSWESTQALN